MCQSDYSLHKLQSHRFLTHLHQATQLYSSFTMDQGYTVPAIMFL